MSEDLYRPPEVIHHGARGYRMITSDVVTMRARHYLAVVLGGSDLVFVKEWLPEVLEAHPGQVRRAEGVYRAVQEAGIEGLVGALDCFWCNGRRYIVTRYISGAQDPIAWCNETRSALDRQQRIAYLLRELLKLVFQLHRLGFVHRDIHWGNVLIDKSHRVYLVDFTESVALDPRDARFDAVAVGDAHEAPGFEPPECREGKPHGPAADVWQACAIGYGLATGISFAQKPEARPDYRDLIPKDLDGGLQDVLSRGLHPEPTARFSSPDLPAQLLSEVACKPGVVPVSRLLRQAALNLDRLMVRFHQETLPGATALGLFSAMVALSSVGVVVAGEAQRRVTYWTGATELGDVVWGGMVAASLGLGAAGEPLWRLDGRGALSTASKAALLSAVGGSIGMALATVALHWALDGSVPGLVVDLGLLPTLLMLAWAVYGAATGLGFGAGLFCARWLGIGRAAIGAGVLGGMVGGALFLAFAAGTLPGVAGLSGLEAARYASAMAIAGSLAVATARAQQRVAREARLKVWAKGCPPEVALPQGEPLTIGRRAGPFRLSWERPVDVPDAFLRIWHDDAGLRLVVLAPGRGLLNDGALVAGKSYRLHSGDWLDIGRRTVLRIEIGEAPR